MISDAYIVPLYISKNTEDNLGNDCTILYDGMNNFSHKFNDFKLLLSYDVSHIYWEEGKVVDQNDVVLTLGNMHIIPDAATYEKERAAGKYKDWEIRNMTAAQKVVEEKKKEEENN